jgi:hypothetical protein
MRTKRRQFEVQLPATPCTPDLKLGIIGIAERQGVSIADVQRQAFEFFLRENVSLSHNFDSRSNNLLQEEGSK